VAGRLEVHLPDIGDFHDVDVVEVLVSVGQRVEKEQSLIVLESDKATMEVPSPAAGVVETLRVGVGDQVSEGDLIAVLRTEGAETVAPEPGAA
jgi:pyruvate/2-oxoglutarate dehydrogenase complex dihydrolipoamide acyltransferase (E2) component